jgi:streptogramin lyase
VFAVDRNGNAVVEWLHLDKFFSPPNTLARGPHKVRMSPYDPDKHVWIIDDDLHEIHKFTQDGKLVMTLGERGVPGRGPNNFNRPTDMVWLPDGTFFIADGYAGTRVAKFDRNGKFLLDWGQVPKDPARPGPNEFYSVHSIGITRDRRLVVSDREHSRMQIFDENGKFLTMWQVAPKAEVYSHIVTEDDHVWAADHTTSRIIKFDLNGKQLFSFGGPGPLPGQFNGVHQIHVDQERNMYVTEVWNGRVQKFRPKKDADPATIIGPEVGGWPK